MPKKKGRKRLPRGERRSETIGVPVTPRERDEWGRAAAREHLPLSVWIRKKIEVA